MLLDIGHDLIHRGKGQTHIGIRCAVVLLMATAVVKLSKQVKFSPLYIVITAAAFALAVFTEMDTILILLIAGIIGVFHAMWKKNSAEQKEGE